MNNYDQQPGTKETQMRPVTVQINVGIVSACNCANNSSPATSSELPRPEEV